MERIREAFGYIDDLRDTESVTAIVEDFSTLIGRFGFHAFAAAHLVNPHVGVADHHILSPQVGVADAHMLNPKVGRIDENQAVVVDCWPEEWAARWVEQVYVLDDPVAIKSVQDVFPFMWQDIRPQQSGRRAMIMDEGREFGLCEGITIPFHQRGRLPGAITIAGLKIDASREERDALHLAAMYTFARLDQLVMNNPEPPIVLAPRERDCLHWVAAGKSDWEIGEIMGLSQHTVHSYIRNAMKKLGAVTRTQAVALACRHRMIIP